MRQSTTKVRGNLRGVLPVPTCGSRSLLHCHQKGKGRQPISIFQYKSIIANLHGCFLIKRSHFPKSTAEHRPHMARRTSARRGSRPAYHPQSAMVTQGAAARFAKRERGNDAKSCGDSGPQKTSARLWWVPKHKSTAVAVKGGLARHSTIEKMGRPHCLDM